MRGETEVKRQGGKRGGPGIGRVPRRMEQGGTGEPQETKSELGWSEGKNRIFGKPNL